MELTLEEWIWLRDWLQVARERFDGPVQEPYLRAVGNQLRECLAHLEEEARCGAAIDAAARAYAKRGRWPRLSSQNGFFLLARLDMADAAVAACISQASKSAAHQEIPPEAERQETALWLLTGYWDDMACETWLRNEGPGFVDLSD